MSEKKEWAVVNPDTPEEAKEILKTKFKVYEDPILEKGTILTGKRGEDVRPDVVHTPYVPLQITPTVLDSWSKKRHPTEGFTEEVAKGEIAEIVGAALRAAAEIDPALKPYVTKAWRATAEACFPKAARDEILYNPERFGEPGIIRPPRPPSFDPGDFTIRKGIRDRYVKHVVSPSLYGTVDVRNMGQ